MKSGNACCHQVQNILTSSLLSKNTKTKLYRTVILPVDLYGCEAWSLNLRENCIFAKYIVISSTDAKPLNSIAS